MYKPVYLKVKRLLSHLDTQFIFNDGKVVLISGINKDDEGQDNNGSGKSVLIEAIALALTGDPFREVNTDDLVFNGKDSAEIEFELYNSYNKQKLHIHRILYANTKPSTLSLTIGGIPWEQQTSVREGNAKILSLLDISKEDLLNYFIISKRTYKSFFLSTDGKKKEIIARFSNSNMLEKMFTLIDKDLKEIDSEIQEIITEKVKFESKKEVYQEELKDFDPEKEKNEKNEKIARNQKLIDSYNKQLKELKTTDKNNEKKKLEVQATLKTLEETSHESELSVFDNQIRISNDLIKILRKDNNALVNEKSDIEKELAGVIECPSCKHQFSLANEDLDIAAAHECVKEMTKELTNLDTQITEEQKAIIEVEQKQALIKKKIAELNKNKIELKGELNVIIKNINSTFLQFKTISSQKEIIEEEIETLQGEEIIDKSKEYHDKITELDEQIAICVEALEEQQVDRIKKEQWIFNFKKFQSYLANQCLKSIEGYVNLFLQNFHTNLQVEITGYRELRSKKIKEEIEVQVLRNGIKSGKFGKFSEGEKVRIDICGILTLQALINLNSSSGGLDLLALDEIIESVDVEGFNQIIAELTSIKQNVLIITHNAQGIVCENKIVILKEGGYSKIKS